MFKILKSLLKPNNPISYLIIFGIIYFLYSRFKERFIETASKLFELIAKFYLLLKEFIEKTLHLNGIVGLLLLILLATLILIWYQRRKILETKTTLFR